MKKTIIIIISIILFHLSARYIINEIYISKINNNNYDSSLINSLFIINYPEPYIAHYNKGNSLYYKKNYNEAIKEYEIALKTVPTSRECKVRNNLSLTHISLLDLQKDNIKEDIEYIQKILLVNNCASNDLISGKDDNSQIIYNELENIKNQNDPTDPTEPKDPKEPDEPTSKEQEIEKKLKEQQIQTQKDREEKEKEKNYIKDYDYYRGKKW